MSDRVTLRRGKGAAAADEFGLASALYTLQQQASANGDLAEGGLKGAADGEPRLLQGLNYQNQNQPVTIGGRHFRITVKVEKG